MFINTNFWETGFEVSLNWSLNVLRTKHILIYRVLRAQADWTFILLSELPAKELRHLPRNMLPRGITY
jgi:hypothetical protein